MANFLYNLALWLALPWVLGRLWWRGRVEPGYRRAVAERFGRYRSRGAHPVIWIHAVSIGETRAARPLVALLRSRFPDHELLITHMTATGREAAMELYGGEATLAWLPYDYPFAVRAFLRHFTPRIGILVETEVWFNLVAACRTAGVPVMLANARMSERSARGYEIVRALSRDVFSSLSAVAAQTDADAARLRTLGARDVVVTGNMKFDVDPVDASGELAALLRRHAGARRIFLAASTREGEEKLIFEALRAHPIDGSLIVVVPRHPQRFADVARLLESLGIPYARRTDDRDAGAEAVVLLGDSLGELPSYYASADVAFVGGSLLPFGGQNLIEACAAGVPVLVGPHTYNFSQASKEAIEAGAAERVPDAGGLVEAVRRLLGDETTRRAMGYAGRAFCTRHRGAAVQTLVLAEGLLGSGSRPGPGGRQ